MAMRERLIFTMKKVFKETEEQVNLRYAPNTSPNVGSTL
jgi:hypothetical protein